MPSAASRTSRSTPADRGVGVRRPSAARRGRRGRCRRAWRRSRPTDAISTMMAKLGTARPRFERFTASGPPRPVCPRTSPSGRAMTMRRRPAPPPTCRRAPGARCEHPFGPPPVGGGREPRRRRPRGTPLTRSVATGPRRQRPLEPEEADVGDDRQRDDQCRADDERRAEVAVQPVEDHQAEALLADQRRDRDEPDRRDRGDADAGDDRGQGERELDPQQLAASRRTPCRPPTPAPRPAPTAARRRRSGRGSAACSSTSGMIDVVRLSPVNGMSMANRARLRDRVDHAGDPEHHRVRRAASGSRRRRAGGRWRARSPA